VGTGTAPDIPSAHAVTLKVVRTIAELRAELGPGRRRSSEPSVGLVPTMGAFHEGHLSLMRRARAACDVVVVSLFVNPSQFNDASDLAAYPRDEARDRALAAALGIDYLFVPAPEAIYPPGFATTVVVDGVTAGLETAHRGPEHFRGVATVVAKLLNIVAPDVVYFGQKDAQQAATVKRMVRDLDMPVRVDVCPTVRGADGLALSSRNVLLGAEERERAPALHRALRAVADRLLAGERDPERAVAAGQAELWAAGLVAEYLLVVDPATMVPLQRVDGEALVVVAARLGAVRLIDNLPVMPAPVVAGVH